MDAALTATCVLLTVAVRGAGAILGFNNYQMQSLVDDLNELGQFDDGGGAPMTNVLRCQADDHVSCYGNHAMSYVDGYEIAIVKLLNDGMLTRMERYNAIVLAYMLHITENPGLADDGEVGQAIVSSVTFNESKAYCVVGFVGMYDEDIPVDDLLSDYVHYYYFDTLDSVTVRKGFAYHVETRLRNRYYNDVTPAEGFESALTAAKEVINRYSEPFCKLQRNGKLVWKNADAWRWKKLEDSVLLSTIHINGQSVFDYEGLEENSILSEVFKDVHRYIAYNLLKTFYFRVSHIMDMFLIKVLLPKAIYLATNAMQLYYDAVVNLDIREYDDKVIFDEHTSKHNYFIKNMSSFRSALTSYNKNSFPNTFNPNDFEFMLSAVNMIITKLDKQEPSKIENQMTEADLVTSIAFIIIQLDEAVVQLIPNTDEFIIKHYTHPDKITMDQIMRQVEYLNILITHIVEVKSNY